MNVQTLTNLLSKDESWVSLFWTLFVKEFLELFHVLHAKSTEKVQTFRSDNRHLATFSTLLQKGSL